MGDGKWVQHPCPPEMSCQCPVQEMNENQKEVLKHLTWLPYHAPLFFLVNLCFTDGQKEMLLKPNSSVFSTASLQQKTG